MNLNGDYISDALAAQVGGIGIAPGGNINYVTGHSIFEATHGTAPKYAGQDKVNPGSVILSGEMMLRRLGWTEAADLIVKGLEGAIGDKVVTYDFERQMEGATKVKTSEFARRHDRAHVGIRRPSRRRAPRLGPDELIAPHITRVGRFRKRRPPQGPSPCPAAPVWSGRARAGRCSSRRCCGVHVARCADCRRLARAGRGLGRRRAVMTRHARPGSQVVRQRTANPPSWVRFPSRPRRVEHTGHTR